MKKEIITERLRIAANQNREARDYWLKKLSLETTKSFFPVDYNVPGEKKPKMEEFPFSFSAETAARLIKFSGNSDVRLHMVMVGVLSVLLIKYTGSSNISIGTPIYKQDVEADFVRQFGEGVGSAFPEAVARCGRHLVFLDGHWRLDLTGWLIYDHLIEAFL